MQIMNMTGSVLFWYPLGVKLTWGHAHKTRSWYLLGVAFKKSDEHPRHFLYGSSPPGSRARSSGGKVRVLVGEGRGAQGGKVSGLYFRLRYRVCLSKYAKWQAKVFFFFQNLRATSRPSQLLNSDYTCDGHIFICISGVHKSFCFILFTNCWTQ